MISELLLLLILIVLNAFFAASEIALISLNDNKIKLLADEGHNKAKLIVKVLSEPSKFLATIQIGITLAGFLASALRGKLCLSFSYLLKTAQIPISENILKNVSVVIITIIQYILHWF